MKIAYWTDGDVVHVARKSTARFASFCNDGWFAGLQYIVYDNECEGPPTCVSCVANESRGKTTWG